MKRYLRVTEIAGLDGFHKSKGGWDGLYYGAEFCPRLLPDIDQVVRVQKECEARGIDFVLVTPLVRQGEFDRVWKWFASIHEPGLQWVANDWGMVVKGAEEGIGANMTAGRVMGRQRRGPRVGEMLAAGGGEELRQSVWDDPATLELVKNLGAVRIELDALEWGGARPPLPPGMELALCGPWIPVTTSPSCPWAPGDPLECDGYCVGKSPVRLENDENPEPLWSKGNTLWARVDEDKVMAQAVELGADRLIWAEGITG